jgi:hypothetical protein
LQHPQQGDLSAWGDVADFIEEQRAALGNFEAAASSGGCASEGSLFVSEQLAE